MDTEQARKDYDAVRRNYYVSLVAAKLMLCTDNTEVQISAHLQGAGGFDPAADKDWLREKGAEIVKWASEENESEFQNIRRAYLIGTCSALEQLAKCCFVEWVNEDSELADRIKLKEPSLLLSADDRQEQIFGEADRVFRAAKVQQGHFQKYSGYIRQLIPVHFHKHLACLDSVDTSSFDEAFLVRNRLVHHGAKADEHLAKAFGISKGEQLQIMRAHVKRYMQAIDAMDDVIGILRPSNIGI